MPVICTPAMATCSPSATADRAGHWLHRIVQPCLRIARIVFPGADDVDRARADQHRRTARLLEPRHAADMIEMLMAAQKRLHIGYLEAKAGDIGGDDFRTLAVPVSISTNPSSPSIRIALMPQVPTYQVLPWIRKGSAGLSHSSQSSQAWAKLFALPCQLVAPVQGSPVQGSPMQRNRQVPWRDRE